MLKELCVLLVTSTLLIQGNDASAVQPREDLYTPDWESLDSRPIPEWYDDAKFGIFLHWGVYSVPSFRSEWFWMEWKSGNPSYVEFMKKNYPPDFTYQQFAPEFTAEFFDPDQWAEMLQDSGAKYVVLTSKHHDGFTLWPSTRAFSWNSMEVGPHRDLVGELQTAVKKKGGMHFGLYYSLYEWYNPMYVEDKESGFQHQTFVNEKLLPEVTELINKYQPEVLWTDGYWETGDEYWKSKEFLAWLFNKSPVKDNIVVTDRWGSDIPCNHGGVHTCTDRYNPGVLKKHKWENCMTVDRKSWGYRRDAKLSEIYEIEGLIKELVSTVSCGGNLLMNIGPTKEGTIIPVFQDRLKQMGQWLKINGDAIYKTTYWIHQNDMVDGNVWYTQSKAMNGNSPDVFAITLQWPKDDKLTLGALVGQLDKNNSKIYMIGNEETPLEWTETDGEVVIQFPNMFSSKTQVKSKWSWSLRITHIKDFSSIRDHVSRGTAKASCLITSLLVFLVGFCLSIR